MMGQSAYRDLIELDLVTPKGMRICGRFRIRQGWTVLCKFGLVNTASDVLLTGPSPRAAMAAAGRALPSHRAGAGPARYRPLPCLPTAATYADRLGPS